MIGGVRLPWSRPPDGLDAFFRRLPVLLTDRLELRALRAGDWTGLYELDRDPLVASRAMRRRVATPVDARGELDRMLGRARRGHAVPWAVTRREDGAFLGTCGAWAIDASPGRAGFGYALAAIHQGQGYATEAGHRACESLLARPEITGLRADVFEDNYASRRVLEKLGFRLDPVSSARIHWDGLPRDVERWSRGR